MKNDGNVKNPTSGKVISPRFLGNAPTATVDDGAQDRLQLLAAWIQDPANDRFAVTQANRIWFQMMGAGIVDPIDDFRATNPAANPELLRAITDEFVRSNYSVRHLMRLIANSKTYQLSGQRNETNQYDERQFSHVAPRRMTAEQTLDAISQVLQVPAKFGGSPEGIRAVQLVGVRNGGNRYSRPENGDRFLSVFGKPSRLQTCECERTGETTLAQTMEMVSGEVISELLRDNQSCVARAVSSDQSTDEFLEQLYWSALSRSPSAEEKSAMTQHVTQHSNRREALQDIVWALLNSNEFLLRR